MKRDAFTLIELLIVIAILALLMSILLPALNRAREQSKKITCANNLKQIGLSLHMYGNENDGKLPLNQAGFWLWDISYQTTDYIISTGGDPKTFYCPADQPRNRIWQFSGSTPRTLQSEPVRAQYLNPRKSSLPLSGHQLFLDDGYR